MSRLFIHIDLLLLYITFITTKESYQVRLHVAAVVTSRHQLGLEEGHQLVHGWPLGRQCMPTFLHLLAEVLWAL